MKIISLEQKLSDLYQYIDGNWSKLVCNDVYKPELNSIPKKSLKNKITFYLPFTYVCPGGRFRSQFYWDSYFIILGLLVKKDRNDLVRNIINNLFYQVKQFGIIFNSNRSHYATRSQIPTLSFMVDLFFEVTKDKLFLEEAFSICKKEYSYWIDENHICPNGLSRFFDLSGDPVESRKEASWDMSPRYLDEDVHSLNPVDLNCSLYQYEKNFSKWSLLFGNDEESKEWEIKADERKKKINEYMWNDEKGLYFDYDFALGQHHHIGSLAAYYPLFVNLSDKNQSDKLVNNLKLFECDFGLSTTDQNYGYYSFQWNYPIGWAPLHWIVYKGLKNYGFDIIAHRIAEKYVKLIFKLWQETGVIWEKYNVVEGNLNVPIDRYPNQKGFGWTNGVIVKFLKELYNI